jgi:predicted ATPase with chaperone activity
VSQHSIFFDGTTGVGKTTVISAMREIPPLNTNPALAKRKASELTFRAYKRPDRLNHLVCPGAFEAK